MKGKGEGARDRLLNRKMSPQCGAMLAQDRLPPLLGGAAAGWGGELTPMVGGAA